MTPDFTLDGGCVRAVESAEAIHEWFELSYASYFVMPRTVLQSMPDDWQRRFVELVEQIPTTLDLGDGAFITGYIVTKRERGRFVHDPLANYERGRRRLPLRRSAA